MGYFWDTLPKPFFILAPMEDVTDTVFRQIVAKAGRPDVFFTEFANTDGLQSKGRKHVAKRLLYTEKERPLVAQIWGNNPEFYIKTAKELVDAGFDGIDINMGCPVKDVVKRGCCSGLIANPSLAKELYHAAVEGVEGKLPVSIKTRIGLHKIATEEWIGELLTLEPAVITVHGRTTKEMSKVPAHWDEIAKAVKLRDAMQKKTLIVGNGDVVSREDGFQKVKETGVDGIMIGRGIFHDPWIFHPTKSLVHAARQERLLLLLEHIELFDKTWQDTKDFNLMRKFYKMYTVGLPDASEMREKLMQHETPQDVIAFLKKEAYQSQ